MTACQSIQAQISAMLDGELTPEELALVQAHLSACEDCRRTFEALQSISELAAEADAAPAGFAAGVMDAVRAEAVPGKQPDRAKVLRMIRRWGSLAACLTLVIFGVTFAVSHLRMGGSADTAAVADGAAPEAGSGFAYSTAKAESSDAGADMEIAEDALNGGYDFAAGTGAAPCDSPAMYREDGATTDAAAYVCAYVSDGEAETQLTGEALDALLAVLEPAEKGNAVPGAAPCWYVQLEAEDGTIRSLTLLEQDGQLLCQEGDTVTLVCGSKAQIEALIGE